MNFLTPPTDSFYKFIAVGGMILFLTGAFLIFKGDDNESELFIKQLGEERILQKEIDILLDELNYNEKYKKLNEKLNDDLLSFSSENNVMVKDSITKKIIYNLPDSIQNKFKVLILKKEELQIKRDFINSHKSTHDSYFIPYVIALYLGEVIGLIGLFLWYLKLQKPIDDEHAEKESLKSLKGEYWAENCQSCLKTFLLINEKGSEIDGSPSKLFCKDCYSQGVFVEQDLTISVAEIRLKNKLVELKYNKRQIKKYLKKLNNSLRWKRVKIW